MAPAKTQTSAANGTVPVFLLLFALPGVKQCCVDLSSLCASALLTVLQRCLRKQTESFPHILLSRYCTVVFAMT